MDINTLRSISTILVLLAFIGVCWWAFAPKRRKRFEEAAKLPFADEEQPQSKAKKATDTKQEQEKL
jgi:cytochrome c oxidase cbb3-type subunit 4